MSAPACGIPDVIAYAACIGILCVFALSLAALLWLRQAGIAAITKWCDR